jgi:hypothetical protein
MLKRILIYCVLGPAFCYVTVLALNPKSIAIAVGSIRDTLPAAYLVLTGPFLVGALADLIMQSKWRMLVVVASVLVATPIAILTIAKTSDTLMSALQASLITIVPAIACSWLSHARRAKAVGD